MRALIPLYALMAMLAICPVRAATPSITSVTNTSGAAITSAAPGATIQIHGSGFGSTQGFNYLCFCTSSTGGYISSGGQFIISSWSDTDINMIVPSTATVPLGQYALTVFLWDGKLTDRDSGQSNGFSFTIVQAGPTISYLSAGAQETSANNYTAAQGAEIAIYGTGLTDFAGCTPAGTVFLVGQTSINSKNIRAVNLPSQGLQEIALGLPASVSPGVYLLYLVDGSGNRSNSETVTVVSSPGATTLVENGPQITSISPNTVWLSNPGEINIYGGGFTNAGTLTISDPSGSRAPVVVTQNIGWSNNQINFELPSSLSMGTYQVTATGECGQLSNSVLLTVKSRFTIPWVPLSMYARNLTYPTEQNLPTDLQGSNNGDVSPYGQVAITTATPLPAGPYGPQSPPIFRSPSPSISFTIPIYYMDPLPGIYVGTCPPPDIATMSPPVPAYSQCEWPGNGTAVFAAKLQEQNPDGTWAVGTPVAVNPPHPPDIYSNQASFADDASIVLNYDLSNALTTLRIAYLINNYTNTITPPSYVTFTDGQRLPLSLPDSTATPDNVTIYQDPPGTTPQLRWALTPPFQVMVMPAGAVQLKVLPLAIVYAPPGDCVPPPTTVGSTGANCQAAGVSFSGASSEGIQFQSTFGQSLSFGSSTSSKIANVSSSSFSDNSSANSGAIAKTASIAGITVPLPTISIGTSESWDSSTTAGQNTSNGNTYTLLNSLTVTQGWVAWDQSSGFAPGDKEPWADEPFWYDLFVLMAHPQFFVWQDGLGATQTQFLGSLPQPFPVLLLDLYDCVQNRKQIPIPQGGGDALTAPDCENLLSLDPFYPAGQASQISNSTQRFLPLANLSSQYGTEALVDASGNTQYVNIPFSFDLLGSIGVSPQYSASASYSSAVETGASSSTTMGLGFLGLSIGTTSKQGTQQTRTLATTASSQVGITIKQVSNITGTLDDSQALITPNMYWDLVFGGILVQDPNEAPQGVSLLKQPCFLCARPSKPKVLPSIPSSSVRVLPPLALH